MNQAPLFDTAMEGLRFLEWARPNLLKLDDADAVLRGRDEVLRRFSALFRERPESLTETDMIDFLDFNKNCHWTGLHRQNSIICSDMTAVRRAIKLLVDINSPKELPERFDCAVNEVRGFGEGIVTPILFVAFPERYGVWNSKSEFALKLLNLWVVRDRGDTKGHLYEKVNNALWQARTYLNRNRKPGEQEIDLWMIDYCWHAMKVLQENGNLDALLAEFRP